MSNKLCVTLEAHTFSCVVAIKGILSSHPEPATGSHLLSTQQARLKLLKCGVGTSIFGEVLLLSRLCSWLYWYASQNENKI
jgi:hypothetical protein